jgi:hypothetical protein
MKQLAVMMLGALIGSALTFVAMRRRGPPG